LQFVIAFNQVVNVAPVARSMQVASTAPPFA
jgi:hypothetical protein